MEHLFQAWGGFTSAAKAAPHILLLADYDGTLATIVGRPEDALLSPDARRKLRALAAKKDYSVGVISGRQLAEVKSLVDIKGLYYSGNHGLEIEGPGLDYVHPRADSARPVMRELAAKLAEALGNITGIIIQEKGLSLSVHYRLAPAKEAVVTAAVKRITARPLEAGLIKVYPMKKLWEIRPTVDWDKGKAVQYIGGQIKDALQLSRLLTVYLGDDTTDDDVFKILHLPDGWGVFVSGEKAASSACYYLNSVAEVEEFLGRLLELK